ncbi:MAG: DNA methyltransferase, partial [Candidatus Omnitrophota bacterium]
PWVRMIEKGNLVGRNRGGNYNNREVDAGVYKNPGTPGLFYETKTLGWSESCECAEMPVPCTVFDPFFGSGTVGVVAQKYNRRFIGLELKPEYCQMARKRVNSQPVAMI